LRSTDWRNRLRLIGRSKNILYSSDEVWNRLTSYFGSVLSSWACLNSSHWTFRCRCDAGVIVGAFEARIRDDSNSLHRLRNCRITMSIDYAVSWLAWLTGPLSCYGFDEEPLKGRLLTLCCLVLLIFFYQLLVLRHTHLHWVMQLTGLLHLYHKIASRDRSTGLSYRINRRLGGVDRQNPCHNSLWFVLLALIVDCLNWFLCDWFPLWMTLT